MPITFLIMIFQLNLNKIQKKLKADEQLFAINNKFKRADFNEIYVIKYFLLLNSMNKLERKRSSNASISFNLYTKICNYKK